jgi:hypothetical protein
LLEDGVGPAEVDVGGCEVAEALVVAVVVVVLDEGGDRLLERPGQVVVLEQDPVLERLVPTFDLALGLRVVGARRVTEVAPTTSNRRRYPFPIFET